MNARYLRVKKWKDWQHYKDREPPWVKLHSKLLRDAGFCELDELTQWQLVRIWMIASASNRFTKDEKGRLVPVVVDDEKSLRRSIQTLKKVPLAMFIREGWLIPVEEDELVDPNDPNAIAVISPGEHGDSLDPPESPPEEPSDAVGDASPLLEVEGRGLELASTASNGSPVARGAAPRALPEDIEHMLDKLMRLVGDSADEGTRGVLAAYARKLPPSSLAKVIETTAAKPVHVRARYANGALQSEIRERSEAA